MSSFPVSLDTLIGYVRSLHPQGDALDNLGAAVQVGARLDEEADALIGHFVDQARRSGASWSQIGTSMGVSKQAAQKRFVPRTDAQGLVPQGQQLFSRAAPRALRVLAAAERTARAAGADAVGDGHIAAALITEPDGLAATAIHGLGVTDDQLAGALGLHPATADGDVTPAAVGDIAFDETGARALEGALQAALRLGHNYIGTEHLLLGVLLAEGPAAQVLASIGLTVPFVESAVTATLAEIVAARGRTSA
jgi:ATP-dependent Clp protease ATP-binding subunit ClpA